jgi:hypothetical protein
MRAILRRISLIVRFASAAGLALTPVHGFADTESGMTYTDQYVIQRCAEPGQALYHQCANEFKAQGASLVQQHAPDLGENYSTQEFAAALRSNTDLASAYEGWRGENCAEMATQCAEGCDNAVSAAQQAYSTPEQAPMLQTAQQEARAAFDKICMGIHNSAGEALANSEYLNQIEQQQGLTEGAVTGDGAGGLGKWGAAGLGAAAALGAMCLFGSACGSDDDDESEEGGDTIDPEDAVDCSVEGSHSNPDCLAEFITTCSEDRSAAGCEEFIAMYCSEENPEGLGSAFCEDINTTAFCDQEGMQDCLSCTQAAATDTPECEENPTACILTGVTEAEMAGYQSACPSDPIFATNEYIEWQLAVQSDDDDDTTTPGGGSVNDPYVVTPTPGEDIDTLVELTPENIENPDYSTVVGDKGGVSVVFTVPQGVGAVDGLSVFDSTSTAIAELCEQGLLANCGQAN